MQTSNEDLFPISDFDRWAASYDLETAAAGGFPFDGYNAVLHAIRAGAGCHPGDPLLDLGVGTGNLARLFSEQGCRVFGLDFSSEMLKIARQKLPEATLAECDLRAPWPPAFHQRYRAIVSAYTFHHFPLDEKVSLIRALAAEHLLPGGRVLIGDIAFANAATEDAYRHALGAAWEQEYYWLADQALDAFGAAGLAIRYQPFSSCAGVFTIAAAGDTIHS